jgi:protein-S-isoprenylcysteine O-methyltransferase Ste14
LRCDVVRRSLVTYTPAAVLGGLAVSQASWAIRDWVLFAEEPSWTMATKFARSALYAAFVFGAAITLLSNKVPRMRDGRPLVAAAALTASFLMIGVNVLPTGPILWSAPAHVVEGGLLLTVIGAALALTALASIGPSFSIMPEARTLVVTGPYRLLRHPMYLAELLMLFGVVVGFVRLTTLVGALSVVGLQIYRIHAEEKLLQGAFPATFADFTARTRFRLIPLLW